MLVSQGLITDLSWPLFLSNVNSTAYKPLKPQHESAVFMQLASCVHSSLSSELQSLQQQPTQKSNTGGETEFLLNTPRETQISATEVRNTRNRCRLCLCIAWMSSSAQVAVSSPFFLSNQADSCVTFPLYRDGLSGDEEQLLSVQSQL